MSESMQHLILNLGKTERGFLSFFPEAMERKEYKAPCTEYRTQSGSTFSFTILITITYCY